MSTFAKHMEVGVTREMVPQAQYDHNESSSYDGAAGHEMSYLDTYEPGDNEFESLLDQFYSDNLLDIGRNASEVEDELCGQQDNFMELDFDD
ncbi:hypothetical protein [Chromobacterium sphagni]|uniref:Uncharacterized protein n=1 Tax=Chromobacterium sphagni TaxID=1903179 RepID=A0ABX3CC27_9NEIS|nr:hypothetical protein [Chromobacterium sphagni]OHX19840.1 hypothetical protein BI344_16465 [Chromobacterium sphagni]